jgi:hypothetical protein
MKKTRGQKSHATVPLTAFLTFVHRRIFRTERNMKRREEKGNRKWKMVNGKW